MRSVGGVANLPPIRCQLKELLDHLFDFWKLVYFVKRAGRSLFIFVLLGAVRIHAFAFLSKFRHCTVPGLEVGYSYSYFVRRLI